MYKRYSVIFSLVVLAGIATGSGTARNNPPTPPVTLNAAPVWVPAPSPQLSVSCQNSTAFEPVTYWPQNSETTYILRARVQGQGSLFLTVAGQASGSVAFDTGSVWQSVEVTAHYTPDPSMPLQLSVSLSGADNCPAPSASVAQPNIFVAP